ncbi:uncharacterized protein LOC141651597 [Silene latifolia]|uniref:uncharacterized protein LOC141651597 n=1 Tax=Silene latifolia TaxID=37657 RepID=UPI003D76A865
MFREPSEAERTADLAGASGDALLLPGEGYVEFVRRRLAYWPIMEIEVAGVGPPAFPETLQYTDLACMTVISDIQDFSEAVALFRHVELWRMANRLRATTIEALRGSSGRYIVVKENNQWYLDSGCSRYMTGDKNLFLSLKPFNGGKVTFGDNNKGKVVGIGKIGISPSHAISEVYLVEGLKHNLLSISQLCDKGNKVVFHSYGCRFIIEGTNNVILEGQRKRNVYMIDLNAISTNSFTCMKATLDDPCLWHKRFAHISSTILNKLKRWDLVEGLPTIKFDQESLCDSCARCKHVRSSFKPKRVISTNNLLELVHMDLCGPMKVRSRGGSRYVFVLVDDYSRYVWPIFLSSKDETFDEFVVLMKLAQNKYKHNLGSIRTDPGTEFDNKDEEEDMNEPDFHLSRDDPPELEEEEEKEIEGTNDELGNPSNEKNKRTETIVDDTIDSSQKEKLESTVITNEAITTNIDPIVVTESTKTQGLDSGGTNSNSFQEGEPSSHNDVPENSKKWRYMGSHPMEKALAESDWVIAMQEELQQFEHWWCKVTTNDYDETFAPVARLEAIRLLIAFAAHKKMKLFQIDVKTAFLNGYLNEEVFVEQPPGFLDHKFQNHVYKLDKALYEFEMSMMGELKFFIGLQIQQTDEGIMIHQQKYIKELIKKFGMQDANPMDTPMVTDKKLTLDKDVMSQRIAYGCS